MLGRFDPRFFERLRGMLGQVILVVATRDPIDLIYKTLGRNSPFENRLELIRLGLLEEEAAAALIAHGAPPLSGDDAILIEEWCGRHPFFIALLGRHIVDAKRFGHGIDIALDQFQTEAEARLREVWRVLSETERQRLRECCAGRETSSRSLRVRGLVTQDGRPFGRVLTEWVQEPTT